MVYMPFRQSRGQHVRFHVRVAGHTAPVIAALIRVVHELDPGVAAYNVTTMEAQLDRSISLDRLMATLTAVFGLLAVVVAAVGQEGERAQLIGGTIDLTGLAGKGTVLTVRMPIPSQAAACRAAHASENEAPLRHLGNDPEEETDRRRSHDPHPHHR